MRSALLALLLGLMCPGIRSNTRIKLKTSTTSPSSKETGQLIKAPSSRPFLPFSDLGAPAGPTYINHTTEKELAIEDFLPSTQKGVYTTLDKLQKASHKKQKGIKKLEEDLGGLAPDEVFYVDNDIIIIKGGMFKAPSDTQTPIRRKETNLEFPFKMIKNYLKLDDFDANKIHTILTSPPSSLPDSQLSLFLPSLLVPQQSRSATRYLYLHPRINKVYQSYLPKRKPQDSPTARNPPRGKFAKPATRNHIPPISTKFQRAKKRIQPIPVIRSLEGDTDVNRMQPLPLPDPDAEWMTSKK